MIFQRSVVLLSDSPCNTGNIDYSFIVEDQQDRVEPPTFFLKYLQRRFKRTGGNDVIEVCLLLLHYMKVLLYSTIMSFSNHGNPTWCQHGFGGHN